MRRSASVARAHAIAQANEKFAVEAAPSWTRAATSQLLQAVRAHPGNWSAVATTVGDRSAEDCQSFWEKLLSASGLPAELNARLKAAGQADASSPPSSKSPSASSERKAAKETTKRRLPFDSPKDVESAAVKPARVLSERYALLVMDTAVLTLTRACSCLQAAAGDASAHD